MRLEGTLDAFSLPDIFQLLSYTKKTGTLHLRRDAQHGVVHLRDGAVTGGRGDAACQALGRRMVGSGLVSDDDLSDAIDGLAPGEGLGKALADNGSLPLDDAKRLASEQVTDAVFELLRWEQGEFAFVMDEADPDDVGTSLTVEQLVEEGRRRLEVWNDMIAKVPSVDAPVVMAASPAGEPTLSRDEWALLSLIDGHRTVSDLVHLSGTGAYVVVSGLAALAERGLVSVGERPEGEDPIVRRQRLLAELEGSSPPATKAVPAIPAVPAQAVSAPVIPERPEPFVPERQPDFAEEPVPALSRFSGTSVSVSSSPAVPTSAGGSSVGSVQGAHALAPSLEEVPVPAMASHLIDRDPSVNKSLLLRLIAGVRGL